MSYGKNAKRLRLCARAAISVILPCLMYSMLGEQAWSQVQIQTQLNQLKKSLDRLGDRVAILDRFRRSIICGRMDADSLKGDTSMYPFDCDLAGQGRTPEIERPRLKVTLKRPGVFSFQFDPPTPHKPLVFATALNRWGAVPQDTSNLRVADVTETGFTVETFDASEPINPSNVSFFFIVLAEPPRGQ